MKKLIMIFALMLTVVGMAQTPVTEIGTVWNPNSTVTVPVTITNMQDITVVSLTLWYSPGVLTYQSSTCPYALNGTAIPGIIRIGAFSLTNTPETVNFTITFTYNGGSTWLYWNNAGGQCEYARNANQPLVDTPTAQYYKNGYVGNTVVIAGKEWMKENLNVGVKIDGAVTQTNNQITEKYCYDNNEDNCTKYGGLYQWDELMGYGTQSICPSGWHVATKADYDDIIYALTTINKTGAWITRNNAGTAMKAADPVITLTPQQCYEAAGRTGPVSDGNRNYYMRCPTKLIGTWNNKYKQFDYELGQLVVNTNSSGFTGLASGWKQDTFYGINGGTNIWTSTEYVDAKKKTTSGAAYMMRLGEQFNGAATMASPKIAGLPVRCIKD